MKSNQLLLHAKMMNHSHNSLDCQTQEYIRFIYILLYEIQKGTKLIYADTGHCSRRGHKEGCWVMLYLDLNGGYITEYIVIKESVHPVHIMNYK